MARPVVHAATEALYELLPDAWREADPATDWATLRYLSLWGDTLGELVDTIDRLDYTPPDEGGAPGDTSDLVDPAAAEVAWLPWLAQLVGIDAGELPPLAAFGPAYGELGDEYATYGAMAATGLSYSELAGAGGADVTDAELRAAIAAPPFRRASKAHVRAVLARYLTGTQRVDLFTHVGGDHRVVHARTYAAETPRPALLPAALERARALPAAAVLSVETVAGASYAQLGEDWATYGAMSATGHTYAELSAHVPGSA